MLIVEGFGPITPWLCLGVFNQILLLLAIMEVNYSAIIQLQEGKKEYLAQILQGEAEVYVSQILVTVEVNSQFIQPREGGEYC